MILPSTKLTEELRWTIYISNSKMIYFKIWSTIIITYEPLFEKITHICLQYGNSTAL